MSDQITDVARYMTELGRQARDASRLLAAASTNTKNQALLAMAEEIDHSRDRLIAANRKDLDAGAAKGLAAALLDKDLTDAVELGESVGLSLPVAKLLSRRLWTSLQIFHRATSIRIFLPPTLPARKDMHRSGKRWSRLPRILMIRATSPP